MGEEPTGKNEPLNPGFPLDYAKPPPPVHPEVNILRGIGGAILGFLAVVFLGFILALGGRHANSKILVIAFFSLAPLALAAGFFLRRRRHNPDGDWFLLGGLIGIGIAALVEGTCFANV